MTAKRKNTVKLYVNGKEMEKITQTMKEAELSNSTYGRKMCLDIPMNTRIDCFALTEIKKLREDVPNIGNAMK